MIILIIAGIVMGNNVRTVPKYKKVRDTCVKTL